MADRKAAKDLILKILVIAGGRLEAKSRLNKAFYAAHVIYWQRCEGVLTDYPVVKLPEGPGIDGLDLLLRELEDEGLIQVILGQKGPFPQYTIRLTAKVEVDATAPEFEPISEAVRWVKRHTVAELSRITHERPSYDAQPRVGYEQPIYLDAVPEDDLNAINARCKEVDVLFREAMEEAG